MIRTLLKSAIAWALPLIVSIGYAHAQTSWVGSWAAAQQIPEERNSLAPEDLKDATLRQVVHLSLGGSQLRAHLSNRFGTSPLHVTSVHIALPGGTATGAIQTASDRALTFSGRPDAIIPAGAEYISDPIAFPVAALADLAISIYFDSPPASETGHPGSRATSWLAHGDLVSAAELPNAKKVEHWYFISAVDVPANSRAAAVAILGDSITDGRGSATDENNRWPDFLARRLQAAPETQQVAVLNLGIGGNCVLNCGLGPNALARFDADVLVPAGVRFLIVLEGVNDLGALARTAGAQASEHGALVERLTGAYAQMIARAHAHGIQTIGATIMPFVGSEFYHPAPPNEADRQAINQWIRTTGHFDAIIDFDKLTRDPAHPDRLLAAFDSGDHLHPSVAGHAAMGEFVPLSLFAAVAARAPKIAFTFDDLPAHAALPAGETRLDIATKTIAALREAHVPQVYGFVNAQAMENQPGDVEVLRAWRAAGFPLGNHTWSHMNLNQHSVADFEEEIRRNEPRLDELMKGEDWHWFRFPYLAEGDTPAKKADIRAFLRQQGYRIAGVTMSFGDYRWNDPYARCKAKGGDKAIAFLKSSYLAAANESIGYYRGLSQTLYGRDIPYVLLVHIGALDAELLPRLLDLYRSQGFEFVTLEEAEKDEFYRQYTDLSSPSGPGMLEGAMAQRNLPAPHPAFGPEIENMCR